MEGGVGLFGFDRSAETLLFLKNCVKVLVVRVVAAALDIAHWLKFLTVWKGKGENFVYLLGV